MTEPKEEKCEACCGSGYINFWTDDGHISMRTCRRCDGYGYIKAKPMTNEKWIKQCTTEQLAEWLSSTFDLCGAGCSKCFVKELCFNEHINKMPSDLIVEWLKQPHSGES